MSDVLRQRFIHWYFEEFQQTDLYAAMAATVEDSPWHRERNVGVHTDMVVSQYLARNNPEFDVRGAIGCAFHDVGKPPAEITKYREDRGHYRAYHGHEKVSARMWEDWAVRNWTFLADTFELDSRDIYTIGWMIEHHVPWATKKDDKLNAFASTAYETLGFNYAWMDMLMADQTGRISDPSHERGEEALEWIDDHYDRVDRAEHRYRKFDNGKVVYMLIGAPGCGKSTFRRQLLTQHPDAATVSMDDMRMEFYGGPYDNAFLKSTKDSSFNAKVDKRYVETLRENDVVILDNTHTVAKARRRWMAPARARDFKLVAVVFPVELQTVLDRQKSRPDKEVPAHVVENMYNQLSLPLYGDFDDIIVCDSNLESR